MAGVGVGVGVVVVYSGVVGSVGDVDDIVGWCVVFFCFRMFGVFCNITRYNCFTYFALPLTGDRYQVLICLLLPVETLVMLMVCMSMELL